MLIALYIAGTLVAVLILAALMKFGKGGIDDGKHS